MHGERLKTRIQQEEEVKSKSHTPAKKEPSLSVDSMTTNPAPSPPSVEGAPTFTPVPDEASEELGCGIITDYLATPNSPNPPGPDATLSPDASLPSTAWSKSTQEAAARRSDHNDATLHHSGIKSDANSLVASIRSVGSATMSRLRRIGSVMSSDEDVVVNEVRARESEARSDDLACTDESSLKFHRHLLLRRYQQKSIELCTTPPPEAPHHGPTPSLVDLSRLFHIPEAELTRIAPDPPSLSTPPRTTVRASQISPTSPVRSTARSCGRATPLRGHQRMKSGEITVKTPFSVKSRRSNY